MTHDQAAQRPLTVLGVDCAVQAKHVGMALGRWDGARLCVDRVTLGSGSRSAAEIAQEWLADCADAPLLALDAPLGWPHALGQQLTQHRAGDALSADASELFNRTTDRFVHQHIGKKPLDVGADRIARTAHAALTFVDALRHQRGWSLPMRWSPGELQRSDADAGGLVEVYPAATLQAHAIPAKGYKGRDAEGAAARERVATAVAEVLGGGFEVPQLATRSDGLDAVLCLLAARDFLNGEAMPPPTVDEQLRQEGWIWVRAPSGPGRAVAVEERAKADGA
ncbi:DUF429 domain-containing protein [Halorhodospira halophila]|uniref:DUF429 domain-containing protein n=1 Tax=Halorhodospira halophila (strain DSM 244 / SL1) TaxID=349124 RepID=A1WUS0_HALHL|nr:DUF429 domain-containing protein [Halorhodospira halophila]ABM61432.1 hypothetical protein Hhal_0650 [Halorhodospira halophila SL1]MBK1728679.1 DUF429 domain-containing protein [Halorhodospira halophila]